MFIILYTLICTHITIIAVTLFLHRSQAHRSVEFNPILQHFFRFWLWLTTGMVTKQWVAIHRKHHRFSDVQGDPHSPHVFGINRVFFGGVFLYKQAARDRAVMDQYGAGTPDDWIEKNIYSAHSAGGLLLLLILNLSLFGLWGWLVWVVITKNVSGGEVRIILIHTWWDLLLTTPWPTLMSRRNCYQYI